MCQHHLVVPLHLVGLRVIHGDGVKGSWNKLGSARAIGQSAWTFYRIRKICRLHSFFCYIGEALFSGSSKALTAHMWTFPDRIPFRHIWIFFMIMIQDSVLHCISHNHDVIYST